MNIIKPPRLQGELFQQSLGACIRQITTFERVLDPKRDTVHEPISRNEALRFINLVHDYKHINSIVNGQALNGFGRNDAMSTHFAIESVAVMMTGARLAMKTRGPVFAPVSGFHHAGWNYSSGFCTFNGIMAAIEYTGAKTPLIIDGDGHWGDGTEDILNRFDRLNKYLDVKHLSLSREYAFRDGQNQSFKMLREAFKDGSYDLIIYQAGADSHIDDKMMAGYLTDNEWRWRDEVIFGFAKDMKIPIVWNLAGGYTGQKTIDLYTDTFETARLVYEGVPRHLLSNQDLLSCEDLSQRQSVSG